MTIYTKEVVLNGILENFFEFSDSASDVYDRMVQDQGKRLCELKYIKVSAPFTNCKVIDILRQVRSLIVQSDRILKVNIAESMADYATWE